MSKRRTTVPEVRVVRDSSSDSGSIAAEVMRSRLIRVRKAARPAASSVVHHLAGLGPILAILLLAFGLMWVAAMGQSP